LESLKKTDHSEDLGINRKITLKRSKEKRVEGCSTWCYNPEDSHLQTRFIWLTIVADGWLLWPQY
jgi:hypothetical protein